MLQDNLEMPSSTISSYPTLSDFDGIDSRLKPYLTDWKLVENYKGKIVEIPGDWNSEFYPVKYFHVVKEKGDVNSGEAENEIGLTLEGGWRGYDSEVIVNLLIRSKDVLNDTNKVSAEILKAGGASMKLYWRDTLVTDFRNNGWFRNPLDKVWIKNLKDLCLSR